MKYPHLHHNGHLVVFGKTDKGRVYIRIRTVKKIYIFLLTPRTDATLGIISKLG